MTQSIDLRRTLQPALDPERTRATRTMGQVAPPDADWSDPPRDPDWALREIVDDMLFETVR